MVILKATSFLEGHKSDTRGISSITPNPTDHFDKYLLYLSKKLWIQFEWDIN
jgi:hypothetical protein